MAYKNTVALYCANRATGLTELWSKIEAMGWVLHDDQSASSYKVYKSNGENSDRITEYVKIDWITANAITVRAYYFWDATTHAGVGASSASGNVTTSETGFYLWIAGNKDLVAITTKVSTTYYYTGFGHMPKRFWTSCLATTQNNETSGSNVVVEVNNTINFRKGMYYQIVGANGEGRDRVQVVDINPNVSLTIASLPRNYNAGALIGNTPSTFGNFYTTYSDFRPTCPYNASGTSTASGNLATDIPLTSSWIAPDNRQENAYIIQPIIFGANNDVFAYTEDYFAIAPTIGLAVEDILGSSADGSTIDDGTSSGSNTSTTLNDTTKAWTTNQWTGKVVLIKAGVGAGQIRKIASNTATQLTITEAWATNPDATSTYAIRDEGWRLMSTSGYVVREAV